MKSIEINGTVRPIAERSSEKSRALKEIRKNKGVPCVIYGGKGNIHFTVEDVVLRNLIYTPDIYIVNLVIDGQKMTAILKEIQFHPVSDKILHIDFLEISASKPIVIEVPVLLEGLPEGVKAGGKLALQMRKLKVKALYKNIPEKLVIDVNDLNLGKTIKVGDLSFDDLELLNAKDNVVCAVKLTRVARGLAAAGKESAS
ncbi:50S ribosomal protein L25 [termite gut metagenome]|jgi:large subunit ribosomal protein L25|uniref:50S ribosomal protein L25 n=2 Tax=termite gut metagenome TaxID=433724 RepID=A0A5J4QKE5_9ZZZZ